MEDRKNFVRRILFWSITLKIDFLPYKQYLTLRPCPLCGGRDHVILSTKMQYRADLPTVICKNCTMVFTNPVPSREIYQKYYEDQYFKDYGNLSPNAIPISSETISTEISRKLRLIDQFLPIKGKKLLEIGPGNGLFLRFALQAEAEVTGVEPSSLFQSALAAVNLPIIPGSFENADIDGQFEIIVMFHVLEHFYDPNIALKKANKLLATDGLLVIEVPNIFKPFRSLDRFFLRYVHLVNYSPETIKSMLENNGFECLYSNQGGNNWRSPQNLFIIARMVNNCSRNLPKQKWTDVADMLQNYRNQWRYWGRIRYSFYLLEGALKRKIIQLLRPIVRRLRGK